MKNILRITLGLLILFISTGISLAADTGDAGRLFGVDRVDERFQGGGGDLVGTGNNIFAYIIGLFYFIAVVFGIYAGFTILTGAGDEEKLKKGKNILIYVVLGLIVIFLASTIIRWVITTLTDTSIVG